MFRVPTIDGTDNGTFWPEFTSIDSLILKIDSVQPNVMNNPLTEVYKFWSELPIGTRLMKLKSSEYSSSKIDL